MTTLLTLTAAALLAAGDDKPAKADKPDAKAEMAKMEGVWTLEKSLRGGEEAIPEEQRKQLRVEVKGDKRTVRVGDEVVAESTFTLDPSTDPKGITVTAKTGPLEGKEMPGIYKLDGDTLTICLDIEGKGRPKAFKSEEGSGALLQVLKRVKADRP